MGFDAGDLKDNLQAKLKDVALHALRDVTGADVVPAELSVEPVYKSDIPWDSPAEADTLIILCGDSRYFPHYHEFLTNSLKLDHYWFVAVPGGIQWLALPDILPKHNKVARGVVEFLVRRHTVTRVVCIAHQSCGVYNDSQVLGALAHLGGGKTIVQHQFDQLRQAARLLRDSYALQVDTYYASIAGNDVVFHKIE